MTAAIDFIFMLTQHDRTVARWRDNLDELAGVGLRHIGCKDAGIEPTTLPEVAHAIARLGARSYLELVTADAEASLTAAERAIESGFDCLLGGADPLALAHRCRGRIDYFPFPGKVSGHPVVLEGTPDDIAADCRTFCERGCPGVDLLLYRAADAPHAEILRKAREATDGTLIVAGSVDRTERIEELKRGGVDAFTIGSAILDGSILPSAGSLRGRVAGVLGLCA